MTIDQTFAFSDIPRVFILAFLELLLSADNATVLGALCHKLPLSQRKKALFIGIASSFVLRALILLAFSFLLKSRWLQILGAIYLIYLSFHHFLKRQTPFHIPSPPSFWKTVVLIELLDLVFAIDSMIAGIAFINSDTTKLWVVYTGGIIGLIGMRYAASFFSYLLDRFPNLEHGAYLLVGWIGLKLALTAFEVPVPPLLFWGLTGLLFLLGFIKFKR